MSRMKRPEHREESGQNIAPWVQENEKYQTLKEQTKEAFGVDDVFVGSEFDTTYTCYQLLRQALQQKKEDYLTEPPLNVEVKTISSWVSSVEMRAVEIPGSKIVDGLSEMNHWVLSRRPRDLRTIPEHRRCVGPLINDEHYSEKSTNTHRWRKRDEHEAHRSLFTDHEK